MEEKTEYKKLPVMQELKQLREQADSTSNKNKTKKLKIPRRAKVSRSRAKKGYIGIIRVDENGNITGEKQILEDSTVRLKAKTYHAVKGDHIGMWEGKYPVIMQPTWKKNPINLRKDEDDINETYGQKYIMARMIGDTIKVKAAAGAKGIMYLLIAAAVGYGIYMLATGQL